MTSPDLGRKIQVTQARQGGFSAHQLPAPVSYGFDFFEFKPRLVNSKWLLDGPTLAGGAELLEFFGEGGTGNRSGTISLADDFIELTITNSPIGDGLGQLSVQSQDVPQSSVLDLDLTVPLTDGITIEGWFTPPSKNTGEVGADFFSSSVGDPAYPGYRVGLSVSRAINPDVPGITVTLRYHFESISFVISETSNPIHLRGVFTNNLISLAVNGSQVASESAPGVINAYPFQQFRLSYSSANDDFPAVTKAKLIRLYYTALRRDQFTPPTV
jgi:hypothetical protein